MAKPSEITVSETNAHLRHDIEATITKDVTLALNEDVGPGDLTAQLIAADKQAVASVMTRVDGVLAGQDWFKRAFTELDPDCELFWHVKDGDAITAGQPLCEVSGNARAMLSAERTALNFLQTMSAVATKTAAYVAAVRGTKAKILDTRKTVPGLRLALKYAVAVGGGVNHRLGLFDGILIKENHIAAVGGIAAALRSAFELVKHAAAADTMIEIEVETLGQLEEALDAGARLILLDNFTIDTMKDAVRINAGRAELEASGGVTLQSVRRIAEIGVDRISIGTLTKDIQALDLSMRFKLY
ncbi:MAG: carboxylating nicotinate-nucleotide diphosphorylase [Burkholderiales bacterium]|jgi:nicotinate-nucleotide pyrophosphorylase (carboxylating)|nr:carboxylating nicotinate-nucleotide diphosphorylase [Rhodocyclaceae bacterium]MCA3020933.1 carboxylating nicotinate-nucleotide diphosphorylase [Rhodocyclaceae bacterium]MCA3053081.1 carboxylating nicotinate-nucleotide diphosphorylase [Rhodocyclaceae bacterium]MCA3083802.1 carboxylating nicotinate-nucleotide diphosphorylase [Rhodocyclaceae bacterium]MCE2721925.1 carboxylating nicotinate-nucleotide diphosphorylase [Betaproteobacteria bacterium]